jgi:hypothetical protein
VALQYQVSLRTQNKVNSNQHQDRWIIFISPDFQSCCSSGIWCHVDCVIIWHDVMLTVLSFDMMSCWLFYHLTWCYVDCVIVWHDVMLTVLSFDMMYPKKTWIFSNTAVRILNLTADIFFCSVHPDTVMSLILSNWTHNSVILD